MFCKKVSGKSKMTISFAYDVEKPRIIYKKNQHESSNFERKKRYAQILVFFLIFVKSGQSVVKLLIQEILVLLNNYFSFFEFWSNLVKLWSN